METLPEAKTIHDLQAKDFRSVWEQLSGKTLKLLLALSQHEEAVAGRINRNENIPSPSRKKRGMVEIYLSPQFALKALLHQAWKEAGITRTELAARLCVDNKEAQRLLDPHYGSKLPKMSEALKVLGHRVVIGLEKCA